MPDHEYESAEHMGLDIQIAVSHNVTGVSLGAVIDTFRPLAESFSEISHYYSEWYRFKPASESWRDVSDPNFQRPYLFEGPAGFMFSFGPNVLSMHHLARFHSFCTEANVRQMIRGFAFKATKLLAGAQAIYSPDQGIAEEINSLIFDGRTFAELVTHLLRLGTPALSFAELDASWAPAPIYYIDRFEDFYATE